jgi:epoxyqueuosine reductase QueG
MSLAGDIKQEAFRLGFNLAGITDASPIDTDHIELLTDWLKAGYPPGLAEKIGNRLFGCDECVLACPYRTY